MLKNILAALALATLCFNSYADSVHWTVYFYDKDDKKMGFGSFSYDPETSQRFYDPDLLLYDFSVDTVLSHYYINLRGQNTSILGTPWWKDDIGDENYEAGVLIFYTSPEPHLLEHWPLAGPQDIDGVGAILFDTVAAVFSTGTFNIVYPTGSEQAQHDPCECDFGTWVAVRDTP
jgi:hypothetical protein